MTKINNCSMINDYGKKPTFSSFLPGISGKIGIPLWCYYVNRGQAITSFGISDKDHAIMEFSPAHISYQNAKRTGFRTFLKINGKYLEPFGNEDNHHVMKIGMNDLILEEIDIINQIKTTVTYYVLPEERVGALIRNISIENLSNQEINIELLDGMPSVIPYGISLNSMKEITETAKAWMQAEDIDTKVAYYRVRASMEDTASVSEVLGGNFAFAIDESNDKMPIIADPALIFSFDNSLQTAKHFENTALDKILSEHQITQNNLPCCFFAKQAVIKPNASIQLYELFGQSESKQILHNFLNNDINDSWFTKKHIRAQKIADELCEVINTQTGNEKFDAYCKQTYLDNILRGGSPIKFDKQTFYLYSRKHGDLERDYNYFKMLPEYYSQGNGNFRDINQNRRSDVLYNPFVKNHNIKDFYNLIQLNGYNPLFVESTTFKATKEKAEELLVLVPKCNINDFMQLITNDFTPGQLAMKLEDYGIAKNQIDLLVSKIISNSINEVNAKFGEGYWCDHWTYNLDLIESYLAVFPDHEKELLFDDYSYLWFSSQANVLPRKKRYSVTEKGIRQYTSTNKQISSQSSSKWVLHDYGKGEPITSALIEKLILLCCVKFATLDSFCMGIEMEGGKPGWYDALNGLPGLLGSSMAETCELLRLINFTANAIKRNQTDILVLDEIASLFSNLQAIDCTVIHDNSKKSFEFWNQINKAKESYIASTDCLISGKKTKLSCDTLYHTFKIWQKTLEEGIKKATDMNNGICPTYFSYDVSKYNINNDETISALEFQQTKFPLFLEAPVHWMKLPYDKNQKQLMHKKILESNLYDKKLKMFKVNASLEETSFEIGRAKCFTPGWLENESIWLHMEYKYLLELLKSELYKEFEDAFYEAAVPFLDENIYGRSCLENSSFIVSSANPNQNIHGRGFVARLSGSTAEFLQMWQLMMIGPKPFTFENNELKFTLSPFIPSYLCNHQNIIKAILLGKTEIIYELNELDKVIPNHYLIAKYVLQYQDGNIVSVNKNVINGQIAHDIRNGEVSSIHVSLQKI